MPSTVWKRRASDQRAWHYSLGLPRPGPRQDGRIFSTAIPSMLPFIARMLTILPARPGPTPTTRRLRIKRLDSTVLVGRQLLKGYPVFDLRGSVCFGGRASCSRDENGPFPGRGRGPGRTSGAVEDAVGNSVMWTTPQIIRTALKPIKHYSSSVAGRPGPPHFLHDQFLILWTKLHYSTGREAAGSNALVVSPGLRSVHDVGGAKLCPSLFNDEFAVNAYSGCNPA